MDRGPQRKRYDALEAEEAGAHRDGEGDGSVGRARALGSSTGPSAGLPKGLWHQRQGGRG